MNSWRPKTCSRWAMAAEIEGWETCTRAAALVTLLVSPAAAK
jgi:hypothetical protein